MNRKLSPLLWAVVLGSMIGLAVPIVSAQAPQLPTGVKSTFDTEEAPVLKVFSAEDDGHRFVAYLVEWKGFEVIVSDGLGRSNFQAGDKIRFIAHKVKLPASPKDVHTLSFALIDSARAHGAAAGRREVPVPPEEQKRLMRIAQGDLDAARNETERFCALNRAAKTTLKAGETEEARKLAAELENLLPRYRNHWNFGNAVQDANQVLGRIALAEGNVAEAKKRLLASADSEGSPQMNSFGPNMQLAKELLAKGERDVVIQYFERCGKFWKMGADRLTAWTESVRKGESPEFGANLEY